MRTAPVNGSKPMLRKIEYKPSKTHANKSQNISQNQSYSHSEVSRNTSISQIKPDSSSKLRYSSKIYHDAISNLCRIKYRHTIRQVFDNYLVPLLHQKNNDMFEVSRVLDEASSIMSTLENTKTKQELERMFNRLINIVKSQPNVTLATHQALSIPSSIPSSPSITSIKLKGPTDTSIISQVYEDELKSLSKQITFLQSERSKYMANASSQHAISVKHQKHNKLLQDEIHSLKESVEKLETEKLQHERAFEKLSTKFRLLKEENDRLEHLQTITKPSSNQSQYRDSYVKSLSSEIETLRGSLETTRAELQNERMKKSLDYMKYQNQAQELQLELQSAVQVNKELSSQLHVEMQHRSSIDTSMNAFIDDIEKKYVFPNVLDDNHKSINTSISSNRSPLRNQPKKLNSSQDDVFVREMKEHAKSIVVSHQQQSKIQDLQNTLNRHKEYLSLSIHRLCQHLNIASDEANASILAMEDNSWEYLFSKLHLVTCEVLQVKQLIDSHVSTNENISNRSLVSELQLVLQLIDRQHLTISELEEDKQQVVTEVERLNHQLEDIKVSRSVAIQSLEELQDSFVEETETTSRQIDLMLQRVNQLQVEKAEIEESYQEILQKYSNLSELALEMTKDIRDNELQDHPSTPTRRQKTNEHISPKRESHSSSPIRIPNNPTYNSPSRKLSHILEQLDSSHDQIDQIDEVSVEEFNRTRRELYHTRQSISELKEENNIYQMQVTSLKQQIAEDSTKIRELEVNFDLLHHQHSNNVLASLQEKSKQMEKEDIGNLEHQQVHLLVDEYKNCLDSLTFSFNQLEEKLVQTETRNLCLVQQIQSMPASLQIAQAEKRVLEAKLEKLMEANSFQLLASESEANKVMRELKFQLELATSEKNDALTQLHSQQETIHQLTKSVHSLQLQVNYQQDIHKSSLGTSRNLQDILTTLPATPWDVASAPFSLSASRRYQ